MAAEALPKPGTKYGPCAMACQHIDCSSARQIAGSTCRFCNELIGYERRFYVDLNFVGQYVHAICLEMAIEEERNQTEAPELGLTT